MAMPPALGIDLGTSSFAVARLDQQGRSEYLIDPAGPRRTPSAILVADDEIHVGSPALKLAARHPARFAELALAPCGWSPRPLALGLATLPGEVVLACLLRHANQQAARVTHASPPTVLSLPCGLPLAARRSIFDAASLAGIDLLDVVDDTTAAALAWREQQLLLSGSTSLQSIRRLLVCDLGASKLSVALVDIQQKGIRVLASAGDVCLGGRRWTDALVAVGLDSDSPHLRERLSHDSLLKWRFESTLDEAKHTLSARHRVVAMGDFTDPEVRLTLTRDQFEQQTQELTLRLVRHVGDLVRHSGATWQQIDHLLLLGGATRMPMIAAALQRCSGLVPQAMAGGDDAVARGAALYAGRLLASRQHRDHQHDYRVVEVTPEHRAVAALHRHSTQPQASVLIPRHTPLPASLTADFVTSQPHQQSVNLHIVTGHDTRLENCHPLGLLRLDQLPPQLMAGWPVTVTFDAGTGGRLRVRVEIDGTDRHATLHLAQQGRLAKTALATWQQLLNRKPDFAAWLDYAATIQPPSEPWDFDSACGRGREAGLPRPSIPATAITKPWNVRGPNCFRPSINRHRSALGNRPIPLVATARTQLLRRRVSPSHHPARIGRERRFTLLDIAIRSSFARPLVVDTLVVPQSF